MKKTISRALLIASLFASAQYGYGAPFELSLRGSPTVRLSFDREYQVTEIGRKDGASMGELRPYILVPKDQQSSLVIIIGRGAHHKTEEMIAQMCEGARVTKLDGVVAGTKVQWWHYRDSHHLYSTVWVTLVSKEGSDVPVYFDLVANTQERLSALEDSCSKIELL